MDYHRARFIVGSAALALVLVAPGWAGVVHQIDLVGSEFQPAGVSIVVGDTVRWVWVSGVHNVESGVVLGGAPVFDGNFRSGDPVATAGTVYQVTFDPAFLAAHPMPGNVYPYYCIVHADVNMVGTVTVTVAECVIDIDCGDGDPCSSDDCDAGSCVYSEVPGCCLIDADCSDGTACNGLERCVNHSCRNGTPPNCDDMNPCTADGCDAQVGCVFQPDDTAACDDGDPCTTEVCVAGACESSPVPGCCRSDEDCDDGDPCTSDQCLNSTCGHVAMPDCTSCVADADCDDGDACSDDACVNGACVATATESGCDDGDACTANDRCADFACAGTPLDNCCTSDQDCDDGSTHTQDTCVDLMCRHEPVGGDDGDSEPPADDAPVVRGGVCGAIGLLPLITSALMLAATRRQLRCRHGSGSHRAASRAREVQT